MRKNFLNVQYNIFKMKTYYFFNHFKKQTPIESINEDFF